MECTVIMMELQMTLEFACCVCSDPVSVTVKCEGKGLWQTGRAVATVSVPCPNCHQVNQVSFDRDGVVMDVGLCRALRLLPEPSLN